MRRLSLALCAALVGLLVGPGLWTGRAGASHPGGWEVGPAAVWVPDLEDPFWSAVEACPQWGAFSDCVRAAMVEAGAPAEAIRFAEAHWTWLLESFQEAGRVDVGYVLDRWLANDNSQAVFLNGQPPVLFLADLVGRVSLEQHPLYRLLEMAFPQGDRPVGLFIWPGHQRYLGVYLPAEGGQRFFFDFDVVDGCHACLTGFTARVNFDFSPDGSYTGASLTDICRDPNAEWRDWWRYEERWGASSWMVRETLRGVPVCPAVPSRPDVR